MGTHGTMIIYILFAVFLYKKYLFIHISLKMFYANMIVLIMLLLNLICWGCLGVWISFSIPHSVLSDNYIKGNYIFAINQIETVDILQNDTIYQIFSIHSQVILITKIPNLEKKNSQCIKYLTIFKMKLWVFQITWSVNYLWVVYGSSDP